MSMRKFEIVFRHCTRLFINSGGVDRAPLASDRANLKDGGGKKKENINGRREVDAKLDE